MKEVKGNIVELREVSDNVFHILLLDKRENITSIPEYCKTFGIKLSRYFYSRMDNDNVYIVYNGKKSGAAQITKSFAKILELSFVKKYIPSKVNTGLVATKTFKVGNNNHGRYTIGKCNTRSYCCSVCGKSNNLLLMKNKMQKKKNGVVLFVWCDNCKLMASMINRKTRIMEANLERIFGEISV